MKRGAALFVAVLVGVPLMVAAQQPVYRARREAVVVTASVRKGNTPVAGLQAADFRLTDSGVRQTIDVASLEDVPIDISLLIDTSGSTTAALETMLKSIDRFGALLKPDDRFRVLTIGLSVFHAVKWSRPGEPVPPVAIAPMAGISLVYDGLYAAATHIAESNRRHAVVAMTDGLDACSLVTPDQIRLLGRRTEAIVHWVKMGGSNGTVAGLAGGACVGLSLADPGVVGELATATGGGVRSASAGADIAQMLRGVLDDYRTSYLLRFTPEGVPQTGWHQVGVEVVSGKYRVRARSGYFGSEEPVRR